MKLLSYLEYILNEGYKYNKDITFNKIDGDDKRGKYKYNYYKFVTDKDYIYSVIFSKHEDSEEYEVSFTAVDENNELVDLSTLTNRGETSDVLSGASLCIFDFVSKNNVKYLKYNALTYINPITKQRKESRGISYHSFFNLFKDDIFGVGKVEYYVDKNNKNVTHFIFKDL